MLRISVISGIVFDLQPKNVGYSAQMTESILKIVPTGDFEANLEIPSADIGFVKNGMDVDLSIDSFPASDFGVLKGKISRIGSDSLKPNPQENRPGFAYPATVELSNQFLNVKITILTQTFNFKFLVNLRLETWVKFTKTEIQNF